MSVRDILRILMHNMRMSRKVYRHRITQAGQVSIPAEVRQRWGTALVAIEDEGDRIVLRPLEDGLGERLRGAWAGLGDGRSSGEILEEIRKEEAEAEKAKWGRH